MTLDRWHAEAMGTVVSVAAPSRLESPVKDAVQDVFERYEAMFSLYRPDSEASRLARSELPIDAVSEVHRRTLDLALAWRDRTGGAFTPYRPDDVIDLAGVVKALAIADAGHVLTSAGIQDWCVNAGGDVLTKGNRDGVAPWVVGIVDPDDAASLLTQHTCTDHLPAIATSGTAERGEHVWRVPAPESRIPGRDHGRSFRQVTVAGPDIVTADVLATAILAGGPAMLDRALHGWPGIEVVAARGGDLLATTGFRAATSAASTPDGHAATGRSGGAARKHPGSST